MQLIIMTSDASSQYLSGFFHQLKKYSNTSEFDITVCGYTKPDNSHGLNQSINFYSIGDFADYPPEKWSDSFIKVLDEVANDLFIMMLDDYWLIRQVDMRALWMIEGYMRQFTNVLKFDLGTDRLHCDGDPRYKEAYNTLGWLDLIKSKYDSPYHMSLWCGMWRRDLMREIIIPRESAQQIELEGTTRLARYGDKVLVLGTKQAPLLHANIVRNGGWNFDYYATGIPRLAEGDISELRELGFLE